MLKLSRRIQQHTFPCRTASQLLSKFYLKKHINVYQVISVAMIVGAVFLAVWDPDTGKIGDDGDGSGSGGAGDLLIGITLTISSRLTSAFISVVRTDSR